MKIIDEKILDFFREKKRCEYCNKPVPRCHPHHLRSRGFGGGDRLDIKLNLIGLCPTCHDLVHSGHIQRFDLLAIVSRREGRSQDEIRAEINRLRRLPKGSQP